MLGSWKNGLERGFGTRNEKVKRDRQRERERERESSIGDSRVLEEARDP